MGVGAPFMLRQNLPAESDEQLTDRAREGDQSAFGELYRRHRKAAESTARCLLRSNNDTDDVVADAFAGVLSALRNGRGPRDNFRRYLLACVRNGCRVRRPRAVPMHTPSIERVAPVLEEPERYVEADTVARAFAALTPRWQYTLWLTEVEQRPAQEVSEHMHLSPNAAAALAHRARQAFATAYLAEHVGTVTGPDCAAHAAELASYVRGALNATAEAALERHLVTCRDCAVAAAELRDVNASLRSIALPGPFVATGAAAASGAMTTATVATAGVAGSAAVATAASGLWSALSGAGLFAKVLVAVLLVAPAIGSERPDAMAMAGRSRPRAASIPVLARSGSDEPVPDDGQLVTNGRPRPARVEPETLVAPPEGDVAPTIGDAVVRPVVAPGPETIRDRMADEREAVDAVLAVDTVETVDAVVADDTEVVPEVVDVEGLVVDAVMEFLVERALEPVVEPIVPRLDALLATVGLESTAQVVRVLRSLTPLLDVPLRDLGVTDLIDVEPPQVSSTPDAHSDMSSEVPVADASAPTTASPALGTPPAASPVPRPDHPSSVIAPGVPQDSVPVNTSPTVDEPDIGQPSGVPPASVALTIDLPPVTILDVAIIDLPAISIPAIDLPAINIPGLTLPSLPH